MSNSLYALYWKTTLSEAIKDVSLLSHIIRVSAYQLPSHCKAFDEWP